ncbi:MAG TPA: pentapeptide repeat-containing protein [Chroococcidiopsis sp.]
MKVKLLSTLAALATLGVAMPVYAESLVHTQQLITTRACPGCDLTDAGLVLTDLAGVNLAGADLTQANLSRANLRNANLRGANLTGAVLFGANLTGADLTGANLTGADLRESYLTGVDLQSARLDGANLMGAQGLSTEIATPEQLYLWGLSEMQRGNYRGAINYYNQALSYKPDFAHAVMARGIARYHMRDNQGALQDAQQAEQLYLTQVNEEGHQAAVQFSTGLQAMIEANARGQRGGGGNFVNFLGGLASLLLRIGL